MRYTQKDLQYYLKLFKSLKRDRKKGGAPHKPILLLAIVDQFENGYIDYEKIFLTPELVASFKSFWSALVETDHTENIALPFNHMRTEAFWDLVPNPGCEQWINSRSQLKSLSSIKYAINYAKIDTELVVVLNQKENRDIINQILLEEYFLNTKSNWSKAEFISEKISDQILHEPSEQYQERINQLKHDTSKELYEEEIFVRSGIFKREVLKVYNNTCAISGFRIDATQNISMVDACHIIPFNESKNDTISNGIALCPNLHRALDRGLISFTDDYQVLINHNFTESPDSNYRIKPFENKMILLPNIKKYYPAQSSLFYHRKKFGFL